MDTSTLAVGIAGLASTFLLFGVVLGQYVPKPERSRQEEFWYTWAFRASMAGFVLLPVTAVKCLVEAKTWVDALLCVAIGMTSGGIGWVAWGLWTADSRARARKETALAGMLTENIVQQVALIERGIAVAEDWERREQRKDTLQ